MNRLTIAASITALAAALAGCAGRRRLLLVTVAGDSMEPTLRDGDRLLALRRTGHAGRGNLVVGRPPGMPPGNVFIKRVRAVAGDVLPDGQSVPPDHCWVEGDAPTSADSRIWGPVPVEDLIAVALRRRRRDRNHQEPGRVVASIRT